MCLKRSFIDNQMLTCPHFEDTNPRNDHPQIEHSSGLNWSTKIYMFKFLKILILSFPKIISTAFRDQEDEHRAEECFSCVSSFVVAQLLHVLGATCGGTCAASPVQDNGQRRSCQIDLKTEKLLQLFFWFY